MMQYLETLSGMECQVYTLNRVYWDLHNRSEQLGHPQKHEEPKKPHHTSWTSEVFEYLWPYIILSAMISTFIAFFLEMDNKLKGEGATPTFIAIVTLLLMLVMILGTKSSVSKRNKNVDAIYEEKMVQYNNTITADNLRVQKELQVKEVLCAQRDAVLAEYWAARNALDALYSLDIIEPEYRDFAAVTTFYSYFRKEYCDRLAGPNQAYDRYDQALKIGEIINKLDVIINKLDEIIKNQAYLAELLRDSNNTLHRIEQGNEKMLQSMEAVEENSNLTEYNTRCAAESSKATALLTLFNTLKQNKDE